MSYATLVRCHDPFHPLRGREVVPLSGPGPLSACAPQTDQPFILLRNGQAVLRADWQQPVESGDLIAVVLLPQGGGGGSNPLKVVLALALSVFAGPIGGAVNGALFAAESALAFVLPNQVLGGLIGMGLNALVSAAIPTPKANSSTAAASIAAASPTYSLSAQGNMARLEQMIPAQYGRMRFPPDFAAQPYVEYGGNEQYLYQLFCLGVDEYDVEKIDVEDTPITNFAEVTTQIVAPGGSLTLFPSNVITSVEVAGQEALTGVWLGPFVANPAGSSCQQLGVDVLLPRGFYYANDSGGLNSVSTTFTVQARTIDDDGVATGVWATIGTHTISKATTTPQRISYRYAVTAGRYEVRFQRTDTKQTDSRYGHEVDWAGLRAYLPETHDFGNVTLLAIRMRATNNLSSQASRKIFVTATRKLRTWNPDTGWSATKAPSRSIAWAIADASRNTEYGAGLPDSRIDLAGLYALDQLWENRNNHFDGRFDSAITWWETISQIAKVGRAKPFMQSAILYVARDSAKTVPVAKFTMRNICRGSFNLEFVLPGDETSDSVTTSYYDANTWSTRRVASKLPGSTAAKPYKMELFGATDRQHVHEEGMYYCACNRYRRTLINFETEMEGNIPSFLDLISISHDMPQWGQSGEIVAWDADNLIATVSEPLEWLAGAHYIALRRRDGSEDGPILVTAGTDEYHVQLLAEPDFTPYTGHDEERTHYSFGWGDTWAQLARVLAVKPISLTRFKIEAINEDPSVHTADQGVIAPAVVSSQLPRVLTAPVVLGLTARSKPGDSTTMLLSWEPSPGADYYLIEQSQDGESWIRTGEPSACNYVATALYGAQTVIRVAAVGLTRGPWVQVAYGLSADYMWTGDANAMWTNDSNTMWRY